MTPRRLAVPSPDSGGVPRHTYTVRVGIEREQWYVAIHPAGIEMKGRVVNGSREDAELQACDMIDDWLKTHATQEPKSD